MPRKLIKQNIEQAIATLAEASRDDLAKRLTNRNRRDAPKGCGRTLLELAEAYALQSETFGGLKPSLNRKLEARLKGSAVVGEQKSRRLMQGTKLVREWNGRTHHVDVVQGGFIWNGSKHQSLSAIAKKITSAHWSGPRFFGL